MKRSKMLDIIDDVVSNSVLSSNVDLNFKRIREMEQELVDDILDRIEKEGMLPPDNGNYADNILDYKANVLKWEPEDG